MALAHASDNWKVLSIDISRAKFNSYRVCCFDLIEEIGCVYSNQQDLGRIILRLSI
jgi:hypothetical protein